LIIDRDKGYEGDLALVVAHYIFGYRSVKQPAARRSSPGLHRQYCASLTKPIEWGHKSLCAVMVQRRDSEH